MDRRQNEGTNAASAFSFLARCFAGPRAPGDCAPQDVVLVARLGSVGAQQRPDGSDERSVAPRCCRHLKSFTADWQAVPASQAARRLYNIALSVLQSLATLRATGDARATKITCGFVRRYYSARPHAAGVHGSCRRREHAMIGFATLILIGSEAMVRVAPVVERVCGRTIAEKLKPFGVSGPPLYQP